MCITAVDLNDAHIALNRLKIEAARRLPDRASFYRFFGEANHPDNVAAYNRFVRPNLDATSRKYWESRDLLGRRHIGGFVLNFRRRIARSFHRRCSSARDLPRLDPREILAASWISEQRAIFESRVASIFEKRFVRCLTRQPASLFGLGIPPAQYEALAGADRSGMAKVLHARFERLACDYLEDRHYEAIVARVDARSRAASHTASTKSTGGSDSFTILPVSIASLAVTSPFTILSRLKMALCWKLWNGLQSHPGGTALSRRDIPRHRCFYSDVGDGCSRRGKEQTFVVYPPGES